MKTSILISVFTLLVVDIMFTQFPPDYINWEAVFIDNFDSIKTTRCNIAHIIDNAFVIALALTPHIANSADCRNANVCIP